ncbi:MAG: DUF4160 domain-containing protein, partial [Bacteroidota bacterium]
NGSTEAEGDECRLRDHASPLTVPRISEFFGIVIYLYYQDNKVHHTPHFHAVYADDEVVISIPDADVLAGSLPSKKEKLVKAWAVMREDELQQAWAAAVDGEPPQKIAPLT